jgi:hypothetical protein
MVGALVEANNAKARAIAAASVTSAAPSAAASAAESSAGASGAPGSGKGSAGSTARDRPGLEFGQRSIADMLGPKTMSRVIKTPDGSKIQQTFGVIDFPTQPPQLTLKPTFPCKLGCGKAFHSVQARVSHEVFKHGGRDGVRADRPLNEMFPLREEVQTEAVKDAVDQLCQLVELTAGMSSAQRAAAMCERARLRETAAAAAAAAAARSAAAAKAVRDARGAERAAADAAREREAGGGRRGEPKRHQYPFKEKVAMIETYDKIVADRTILNKGEAFYAEAHVNVTCVVKWAKPEMRAKIYRASELLSGARAPVISHPSLTPPCIRPRSAFARRCTQALRSTRRSFSESTRAAAKSASLRRWRRSCTPCSSRVASAAGAARRAG